LDIIKSIKLGYAGFYMFKKTSPILLKRLMENITNEIKNKI